MILQSYINSIFINILTLLYMQCLAKTNTSFLNKLLILMSIESEDSSNMSNFIIFIPILNLIVCLFFWWIILTKNENIEKFVNKINDQNNKK